MKLKLTKEQHQKLLARFPKATLVKTQEEWEISGISEDQVNEIVHFKEDDKATLLTQAPLTPLVPPATEQQKKVVTDAEAVVEFLTLRAKAEAMNGLTAHQKSVEDKLATFGRFLDESKKIWQSAFNEFVQKIQEMIDNNHQGEMQAKEDIELTTKQQFVIVEKKIDEIRQEICRQEQESTAQAIAFASRLREASERIKEASEAVVSANTGLLAKN